MSEVTVTNDVSAIQPEIFEKMVQVPLYKSLVSLDIAAVHDLPVGTTIHIRRFGDLSAQTYTPGTAVTATAQDWAYDNIVITTYKHVTFYVDDVQKQTIDIDQVRELASEAAYQIKNKIDRHVFANVTGSDGFLSYGVDASSLQGGTAHRNVSAGSANIINIFGNARKVLRLNNVEEMGDWCAVISPKVAAAVEIKAATSGFNVADATLRNGYAGDFMGFETYISNNLPTGECSAISTSVSAGVASGNCMSMYFGRKGTIDVYLQPPRVSVRPMAEKVGSNYITYTVYGSGVTTKNRSRGLNVAVHPSYK